MHGAVFERAALRAVDDKDLGKDLPRRQIAHKPVERRGAELAPHAAAHLRRNALRRAVFILHEDALDEVAVRKGKEIFLRAVLGGEHLPDAHGLVFEALQKFFA